MLGESPQPFLLDFPGLLRNVNVLEQAAAGRGLISIKTERDGIVRRVPMIMQAQGTTRVATRPDTIFIKSEKAGIKRLDTKGFEIPNDYNRPTWVHFSAQST